MSDKTEQERGTVSEHTPFIDFANLPAPREGLLVTQFITVRSVARARAFYSEVLGGQGDTVEIVGLGRATVDRSGVKSTASARHPTAT